MVTAAALVVLVAACLGAGTLTLRVLDLWQDRPAIDRAALSFAVGLGLIGWLFFWLGIAGGFHPAAAWAACLVAALGLFAWTRRPGPAPSVALTRVDILLLALLAVAFLASLAEGLSPPVDADTLSYHFEFARRFARAGHLIFVPRAIDGAVPLLVQMTYTAAWLLGGEAALPLWTFLSGWAASLLLFVLARRWLGRTWSLALALLFQTLPATVYMAGSGQVETRLALFVLVAVAGLIEARRNGSLASAVLVGLGAGFYAGGKYTGLLFVAATGLALLAVGGPWLRRAAVCAVVAALAGGQWYAWNFVHTGDPVFPVLYHALGVPDGPYWDADYAASMKAYLGLRYDQITWWQRWLAFPVVATLFPPQAIEAGRVGFGPFFLMIAPAALIGVWQARRRAWSSELGPVALAAVLFYVLWLKFGGFPKVKHLLPVLPMVLLCMGVAAHHAADRLPALKRPLVLAAALSLALGLGALALFARPFVVYAVTGQTRDSFLTENVNGYAAVRWLNQQEGVTKVLVMNRQYQLYISAPSYFAFPIRQKLVETRPGHVDPATFWRQIREMGFSHILTDRPTSASNGPHSVDTAIGALAGAGCLALQKSFTSTWRGSRTVPGIGVSKRTLEVWTPTPDGCRLGGREGGAVPGP